MVSKESTNNIFWNKPCDLIDGNFYIPSIINDKLEYYQNIYIEGLNQKFNYYVEGNTPGDQKGIFSDNLFLSSLVELKPFTKLSDGMVNFYNSVK